MLFSITLEDAEHLEVKYSHLYNNFYIAGKKSSSILTLPYFKWKKLVVKNSLTGKLESLHFRDVIPAYEYKAYLDKKKEIMCGC